MNELEHILSKNYDQEILLKLFQKYFVNWIADGYIGKELNIFEISTIGKKTDKEVLVKVDRKLGEKHPNFDFIYPVNYGYISNTLSEDNEEIDAYILGVFYRVDEFQGICKAIICRYNDNENKLIVVPKDKNYTIEQMEALLEFQERFFKHKIIIE